MKEFDRRYAVGADIGGSHISSAVVDTSTGEIVTTPATTPVDCHADAMTIISAWCGSIRDSLSRFDGKAECVGMAIPGPFDYKDGVSLISGVNKFDSLFGLNVRLTVGAMLRGCGIKSLRFVNDASAFALGECLGGAARGVGRVVALTLGTGVGSGFVADNKLVETGESVPANGWVYCLPFENGIADEAFSTRWMCRRYQELTGRSVSGVKDIADVYNDDSEARIVFDEYGRRLGSFALPLLKRFDARTLLLGGNISRAFPLFGSALKSVVKDIDVRVSKLLDDAAMVGAVSLFVK